MRERILLFDLGGVLVDLGDPVSAIGLDMSTEDFWKTWLSSPLVHALETGGLSVPDFLADFGAQLGIPDATEFEQRLRHWTLPLFPGAEAFLESLTGRETVALLSNTNEIHWQQVLSQTAVFDTFSKLFLSFETGNAKPHAQSFLDVVAYYDCAPSDVIFMDDNASNIAAASALGIRARHTVGIDAARKFLLI